MATEQREKALREGAKPPSVETFPWERQPAESVQAYARFLTYRNTDPSCRSIRKLGISMQLAARWSRRHQWVKRAQLFDDWQMQLSDKLAQHAVLSHRAALVRFGSVSLSKAEASAAKLDEAKLTVTEINRLAKTGAELASAGLNLAINRPAATSVVVQTALSYGEARPSWLERSEAKESQTERIVGKIEEKVLEASEAGVPHMAQAKLRGKLKQLVLSAPVRTEDP